jgi:predicted solute-binding protein
LPHNPDAHTLRLGYPDRADYLPLLYPLQAGWAAPDSPWKLEVVNASPGDLGGSLLEGDLDAAFVPPLTLSQNGSRLEALGGWGVSSEGPSELALLLAPQRLDLMDGADLSVHADASGSTAEHLLRLLLKPYYDIALNLHAAGDSAFDPKGMRLLLGDNAPREASSRAERWVAEDMGVAWFVLSGLPTVWEILATPRDLEARKPGARPALQAAIERSRRSAQEQSAAIVQLVGDRLALPRDRAKEFLARRRYTLSDREQKALAHFFTLVGRET